MSKLENFVQIAESQVGYKEQGDNITKYGQWYGWNGVAWCAMFVSWCANNADILYSVVPKFASCIVGVNWYKAKGRYGYKGSYTPKRGDIIFFGSNGGEHVGLVSGYNASTGVVTTVEGNYSNAVMVNHRPWNHYWIHGYGNVEGQAAEPIKYTHISVAQADIVQSNNSYISTIYAGQRCELMWVTSDYRKYVRLSDYSEGLVEEGKTKYVVALDDAYTHYNSAGYTIDVKDSADYTGASTGAVWADEKVCVIWTNDKGNCFIAYDNSAGEKLCKTGHVPAACLKRIGEPEKPPDPTPTPDPKPDPTPKKYEYTIEALTSTIEEDAIKIRDELLSLGYFKTKIVRNEII